MKQAAAQGVVWSWENLDKFLLAPKTFIERSRMSKKLKSPDDRANVIAYLKSLQD